MPDTSHPRYHQHSRRLKGSSSFILRLLTTAGQLVLRIVEIPVRYIFGRDIFISYSRRDSRQYAPNLALIVQKLYKEEHKRKLTFYLDRWIAPPSVQLPLSLRLQLRWSSMLVVICTKGAVQSDFVKEEVARYAKLKRKVLTVDVDGAFDAVQAQEPWVDVSGADPEGESWIAVERGEPSNNVIDRLLKMAELTTQDQRLRRAVWGTLAFVALSVGGTGIYSFLSVRTASAKAAAEKVLAQTAQAKAVAFEKRATDAEVKEKTSENKAAAFEQRATGAEQREKTANESAMAALEQKALADRLRDSALLERLKEEGRRIGLLASSPGREVEALEQSIQLAGPWITSGKDVPPEMQHALADAVSAAQYSFPLRGHSQAVTTAHYSDDGKRLITVSTDGIAIVWDVATHRQIQSFSDSKAADSTAQLSSNGQFVITSHRTGVYGGERLRVWNTETGEQIGVVHFPHVSLNAPADVSADGKWLVFCTGRTSIQVWNLETGRFERTVTAQDQQNVNALQFSPDGSRLVAAWDNHKAQLWDDAWKLIAELKHEERVLFARFGSESNYLLTYDFGKAARMWDAKTGQLIGSVDGAKWLGYSKGGMPMLATLGPNLVVRIWQINEHPIPPAKTGKTDLPAFQSFIIAGYSGSLKGLSFESSPIERIITGSSDGSAEIWDVPGSGKSLLLARLLGHRSPEVCPTRDPCDPSAVLSVEFSPDRKQIATASKDHTARLWNIVRGDLAASTIEYSAPVTRLAMAPDGKQFAAATKGGNIFLTNVATGESVRLGRHGESITALQFSADGKRILSTSEDRTAQLWDRQSAKLISVMPHDSPVICGAFLDGGTVVFTVPDQGDRRLWNGLNGKPLGVTTRGEDPRSGDARSATSPSCSNLETQIGKTALSLLKTVPLQETLTAGRGKSPSVLLAISHDGERAVRSDGFSDQLWDLKNGRVIAPLPGHRATVLQAEFSPDGSKIMAISLNTVRVFDGVTGYPIIELNGHINDINYAVWSKDGRFIVTGAGDSTARVFDISSAAFLGKACGLLTGPEAIHVRDICRSLPR